MRLKALLAVGVVFVLFAGCAKDQVAERRYKFHSESERLRFAQEHNLNRLPQSDIPLVLNDRVYAWMDYFQGVGRRHFERYLERSGRYMKMMRDILKQNGLPQDLVYVALIESGFNNNAYSRAAAVGPWQFIRGTGSRYDLDINGWIDERRDPVKATWAAARYLRDLYGMFGDWYLAMAAYNAGEGRIGDAVERSGTKNFWVIADSEERYVRAETRDYVPKFIAAAIMAKMPANFGFVGIDYQKPLEFDTATVETQTDLDVIADCAGVSTGDVADLNPHLVRGSTPPYSRNYEVKLPKGTVPAFKEKYANLPESERVKVAYHKVRRGESVASIAKRYGVSKSSLIAANDISRKHKLRTGSTLIIPKGGSSAYAYDDTSSDDGEKTVRTKKLVQYRVKKGDTVSRIASRYNVTPGQIKSWNSITKKNPLRAGRVLKIYKPVYVASAPGKGRADDNEGAQHSIQSGDTLWSIAQRYGMSVNELVSMNGIDASTKIKPGQKIVIRQKQGKTVIEAKPSPEAQTVNQENAEPAPETQMSKETKQAQGTSEKIAKAAASEASPDDIDLSVNDPVKDRQPGRADKVTVTAAKKYTVKKGDSLGAVARKHGVSVSDLMKWNGIKNPKAVRAGQVLKIKSAETKSREAKKQEIKQVIDSPATPQNEIKQEGVPLKLAEIPAPVQKISQNYKVKPGDTLWDIARRHKVTIAEIQEWNNLSDPSAVKPGDSITIHNN